jgi:hypothetical protein
VWCGMPPRRGCGGTSRPRRRSLAGTGGALPLRASLVSTAACTTTPALGRLLFNILALVASSRPTLLDAHPEGMPPGRGERINVTVTRGDVFRLGKPQWNTHIPLLPLTNPAISQLNVSTIVTGEGHTWW